MQIYEKKSSIFASVMKVLFVCHGNICRSAMADPWYTGDFETTFQDLLEGCEAMLSGQDY